MRHRLALRLATVGLATAALAPLAAGTAAAAPAGPTSGMYVGIQLHALWSENTAADVERQLDLLARTNSRVLRIDVAWSSLMPARGTYSRGYQGRLDALAAGATRRGIRLLPNVIETPCWASAAPESLKQGCAGRYWERGVTKYPPSSVSDFAAVTSHLARRYRSSLAALEIWNEPNYNSGGYTTLNTTDRPRVYTAMVKAAFRAIKAAAPEIPVLAGATSFADTDFLRKLYSHGIRGHYDGISVHPYNEWRAPGAPHDPRWAKYDLVLGMQAVRRLMSAYGDSSPVWITELGWTTCRVGSGRWCITEAQQADYLARAVPIVRSWPWVRSLVVYNLRDKGTDPTDGEHGFGLVRRDYSPKPALAAVARAFAAVPAPRSVATTSTTLRRTSLADLRATSRRH